MGKKDWAVVVGIDTYFDSHLPALHGPENDAHEFYEWVIAPDGGAVPEKQALRLMSSEFPRPFQSLLDAKPTAKEITEAFETLRAVAEGNAQNGDGFTIGRRIYLFFAGHGFAPSHRQDQTALIVADAQPGNGQIAHFLGSWIADWFYEARLFEEVFLFMDCCRSSDECPQLYTPFDSETAQDFWKVRRFYAYGSRAGKEARERDFGGKVHGVFTRTLLDGLRGAAYDPDDPSRVTAESLRNLLYNAYPEYMDPKLREDPEIPTEPEVQFEAKPEKLHVVDVPADFMEKMKRVFGSATTPKFPVRVTTAAHVGKEAQVLDKSFASVLTVTLAATTPFDLERGMYALIVPGAPPATFEVKGSAGGVDVTV